MRFAAAVALIAAVAVHAASAANWAVSVPAGKAEADRLADEYGLRNAGEIVPESNIFHFKVPTEGNRKKRRAPLPDTDVLAGHSSVAFIEKQNHLTRVKRAPVPQGSPGGTQICFIHTVPTKDRASKRCVFPFSYKGKTYNRCTADHSVNNEEWCATEVNAEGDVVTNQWGDCDYSAVRCFGLGDGGVGQDASAPRRPPPPQGGRRPGPPPQQQQGGRRPQLPPPRGRLPPPQQQDPRFNPFLAGGGRGQQGGGGGGNPQFGRFPPPQFSQGGGGQQQPQFNPQQFRGQPRLPPRPPQGFGGNGGGGVPPQLPLRGEQGGFPFGQFPGAGRPPQQSNFLDNEIDGPPVNLSSFKTYLDDKAWPQMWFLNRGGDLDMNVEDAWAQGYSGKGVKVTILDDGIEHTHEDLKDNYDQDASIDLNDDDPDPFPRYDFFNSNKHGTRCAGTVAASANNSECAVGIAFNAGIGGVRILDGHILDVLEAQALSFNRSYIDIYSASWGPDDNGKTVDGPGEYAFRALRDGIEKGRQGKGSIFVWASGNGGKYLDNCNADGYNTAVYTLSISSASENGLIPWYAEQCSSSLATTYSSGSKRFKERKVITTDLHGECTDQHTGTSASSPMAAGIVALTLEANPELNWRDVQHITVRNARPKGNLKAEDWSKNGVGREFSHAFGFGLMDAGQMTRMAKDWKTVPEQVKCRTPRALDGGKGPIEIGSQEEKAVMLDGSNCDGINFLEHVHLHIDLKTQARRGDLSVMLRSPSQTVSILLAPRPFDDIRTGLDLFDKWPMMSVHFWGEPVAKDGDSKWFLFVKNDGDRPAVLNNFDVTFYGTEEDPQPGVRNLPVRPEKIVEATTLRPKFNSFSKDFAHPKKAAPKTPVEVPKGAGYANGYGVVSESELATLLEADNEFQLDLSRINSAEDELSAPVIEKEVEGIVEEDEDADEVDEAAERTSEAGVALLAAAVAETEMEKIQPKTLSVDELPEESIEADDESDDDAVVDEEVLVEE